MVTETATDLCYISYSYHSYEGRGQQDKQNNRDGKGMWQKEGKEMEYKMDKYNEILKQ